MLCIILTAVNVDCAYAERSEYRRSVRLMPQVCSTIVCMHAERQLVQEGVRWQIQPARPVRSLRRHELFSQFAECIYQLPVLLWWLLLLLLERIKP